MNENYSKWQGYIPLQQPIGKLEIELIPSKTTKENPPLRKRILRLCKDIDWHFEYLRNMPIY